MRSIIVIGWCLSGVIALTIIGTVAYLSITKEPTPQLLEQWGGIIIGFYFGQFASMVKDYIHRQPRSQQESDR